MRRAALLLVGLSAACAPVRSEPVPESPRSVRPAIVSLNPCSDAVLAEVAEPAQILGLSHYSSDPRSSSMDVAQARAFRSIGDSAEEVLVLRPDVVVASPFIAPAIAQAIEARGLRLVRLPIARSVAESRDQVRLLARLAGRRERGEALVARIDAALAAAAPPTGAQLLPALVWQSGGIVAGDDTLAADVLRHAGFVNATAARGLRQADYLPLERMIANPPRVILAAGGAGEEDRLLSHPALADLAGTRRAAIDPALLWCGGPTIVRLAARLAQVRKSL
jgi:iron complex transport system substrate-binding protein